MLSQLHPDILDRHEFQFELLAGRPVGSAIPRKSSVGLTLQFALADIADIGAYHEAEQMLGIDALRANAAWEQRGETHGNCPASVRTDWHSQSHGYEMESKRQCTADRRRTGYRGHAGEDSEHLALQQIEFSKHLLRETEPGHGNWRRPTYKLADFQ